MQIINNILKERLSENKSIKDRYLRIKWMPPKRILLLDNVKEYYLYYRQMLIPYKNILYK
jgi:hypothetical protein